MAHLSHKGASTTINHQNEGSFPSHALTVFIITNTRVTLVNIHILITQIRIGVNYLLGDLVAVGRETKESFTVIIT